MLEAVEGLDVLVLVLSAASVAAGVLLGVRAARNAASIFIASWFVFFGVLQLMSVLGLPAGSRLWSLLVFVQDATQIGFAIAYPAAVLSVRQRWLVAWTFLAGILLALIVQGDAANAGPSFVLAALFRKLAAQGVVVILAWRWLRERGDHARTQLSWVLVPLAFWIVHDGLSVVVGHAWPFTLDVPRSGQIVIFANLAVETAGILLVAALSIWCLARAFAHRTHARVPLRRLGVALLVLFPLSAPQFFVADDARLATHFVMDNLALLALFYGVARYKVLDLDLKVRWGVARGTLAAFFLAAFFLASEAASTFLGESTGSAYWGIAGASLLVFAIAPLQRLAERVSASAVPMQQGPDAYLTYRRLHIYRAALEGALRDGAVKPGEQESLRALRRELGVSEDEHALIEQDVRVALGVAAPAA